VSHGDQTLTDNNTCLQLVPVASLPSELPNAFTLAQARAAGVTKKTVYRLRDHGEIEVIGRGVFRRVDTPPKGDHELVELALRAPLATLCLETALARHGLSDALTSTHDLALPRGTRPPVTQAPIQWHFFQPSTFELGRNLLDLGGGVSIGLYSAERSIVDAFRLRGREGHDVAIEALRRWLRRRGSEPARLIALAAQLPRASTSLRQALEVLL
jgi:hypothetical protein